jgi:hypothetical protein
MTHQKRHPERETAIVAETPLGRMFICGIEIVSDHTEPVSLSSRHHPGFGMVALLRNGKPVEYDVGGNDLEESPTLQHYENRAARNPRARWELEVAGPMSGYTLRRIRGNWYVTETNHGFA